MQDRKSKFVHRQLTDCNTNFLNQLVVSTFDHFSFILHMVIKLSSEADAEVMIRIHPDVFQKAKLTFGLESPIHFLECLEY